MGTMVRKHKSVIQGKKIRTFLYYHRVLVLYNYTTEELKYVQNPVSLPVCSGQNFAIFPFLPLSSFGIHHTYIISQAHMDFAARPLQITNN